MAGWDLKKGKLVEEHVSTDEYWSLFNYVFSDGYVGDSDPPRRFLWYRVDGSAGTTSSGSGTTSTDFGTTIVG